MSVTQEIKSRLDLVEVVERYLPLRKSGSAYTGFCPFHQNSRTPAFVVFPHTQTWRCFGACADGGDVFSFLMKKEGWDFKEALRNLAEQTGVELEQRSPEQIKQKAKQDYLSQILTAAADYFHQLFLYAPQAEFARDYVEGRGLSQETVSAFQIGFSLDSWDAAKGHFAKQGYSEEDLLNAGILKRHEERGTTYDRFRNRLMIPIRNVGGDVVGFGARAFSPDDMPKYLNSPQTAAFDKSRLLFGLDTAKRQIRQERQAVIVEGYMDVMQAWQAGIRNVVAQMGTALTGAQLGLLKRYAKQFVIALDSDAAGSQATLRSLEVARNSLDREADTRFDPRGWIRHEGRLKADIRVATLPAGKDPDDLIRENPDQWRELIANAPTVVRYVINALTADLDLSDAKGKTAIAQQILPLIQDVDDPVERDHYLQQLAQTLQVDARALQRVRTPPRARTAAQKGRPAPPPPADVENVNGELADSAADSASAVTLGQKVDTAQREAYYLRHILEYPQLYFHVNRLLRQNRQASVTTDDFSSLEHRHIFAEALPSLEDGVKVEAEALLSSLDEPISAQLSHIVAQMPAVADPFSDRFIDRLALAILDWRAEKIQRQITEITLLVRQAQAENNEPLTQLYERQKRELPSKWLGIKQAKSAMSAVHRRRAEESKN